MCVVYAECMNSSVASPICQEGQSERTFPIFAFSFQFLPIFLDFFLFFPDFGKLFAVRGGTLSALLDPQVAMPLCMNYKLITAYLLLRVNLDKIMHAGWDFDTFSARTRRVSALNKHQNWSASALFCLNSRAQSKYAVVNLIHTRCKQTFLSFIMW